MKNKKPIAVLRNLLKRDHLKVVVDYMKDASQSRLPRSMTKTGSLKHLAYSLRDGASTDTYELLLQDLYLVAITHPYDLGDLIPAIEVSGSARLQRFVASIEPDADTSGMMVFELADGKVAFNTSTKNLASIALADADIYIANSAQGACVMTRRVWRFDSSFKPVGFKRVHPNLFVSNTSQHVDTKLMDKALKALRKK